MSSAPYTIVRSLGVGALSEALLARGSDAAPCVVKRLHPHLAHDRDVVSMFHHEARVLAALDHVGIARCMVAPREEDPLVFVQSYVPGVALVSLRHAQQDAMPLAAACALVARLLDVLDHVHTRRDRDGRELSIVHRDVCPSNVIVAPDGGVALVDFGIATSVWRPDARRGQLKGTRGYMAPEVVTGERDADARSDLFSVGVMLYELTVGRRLYEGSPMRVMAAIADGPTPSPARDVAGYPLTLDAVVQRAMARSVDDRYVSARAFAEDLDGALEACGLSRTEAT
jgi:serine/threonine-protein kinase